MIIALSVLAIILSIIAINQGRRTNKVVDRLEDATDNITLTTKRLEASVSNIMATQADTLFEAIRGQNLERKIRLSEPDAQNTDSEE